MAGCTAIEMPTSPSIDLSLKGEMLTNPTLNYRSVIGSILYLAVKMRSDIAVAASILAQYVESPTRIQFNGAKRVLRYLKGTSLVALMISPTSSGQLCAYVDASWQGEPGFGCRSRTGSSSSTAMRPSIR